MHAQILGAVLAGGRSRRFGGDKAEALLDGIALMDRAIASLRAIAGEVVVCGRERAATVSLADRPGGGQGPLAGLNAALHYATRTGRGGVLTLGCDMPFLAVETATRLIGDGAAVLSGQHLVGYWPSALAPALDTHLARTEDRSVRGWLATIDVRLVKPTGPPPPNINTPADLDAVARGWLG